MRNQLMLLRLLLFAKVLDFSLTVTHHLTHGPHLAHTFGVSTTVINEAAELHINCIIARFSVAVL